MNEDQPRDELGRFTFGDGADNSAEAIRNAASDKPKYNPTGKLSVEKIKKIKPEHFYKYEYLSKSDNMYKPLKPTDNPMSLHKSGYEIREKELYRYTE